MKAFRIPIRSLTAIVFVSLAIASISSCGENGIGDLAGGGTGGTGISTGAITGFGSVAMNGADYKTFDGPGFKTKKIVRGVDRSGQKDQDVFSVGMIVTLHHSSGDNNATEINYEPNLVGPIERKVPADNAIVVLGLPVIVDNATLFAELNPNNVVEVSGFVDNDGRIRATFVAVDHPAPASGEKFKIRGFISDVNTSDNTFHLRPLPDGSGNTVMVSYTTGATQGLPAGPMNGMYVEVKTTDTQTVNGQITASEVTISVARTDFPENTTVDLEGLVTKLGTSSGNILTFYLEGKSVRADGSTGLTGGAATDVQANVRIQVHGKEIEGSLAATRIIFRR